MKRILTTILGALALTGCDNIQQEIGDSTTLPECHIVFDAASGDTTLFIYEAGTWTSHKSSEGPALATIIEKNDSNLINNIVTLDLKIKEGFDRTNYCSRIKSVKFYATAGMRLTERENAKKAPGDRVDLWKVLRAALAKEYPNVTDIETRTITGFEEGLFDWLATKDDVNKTSFGIVAMGGASSQVAFPCSGCPGAQIIYIGTDPIEFYSRSFLGLGGSKLPDSLNLSMPEACEWGIGERKQPWQRKDCADKLGKFMRPGITDPYNNILSPTTISVLNANHNSPTDWYLTGGSFTYMDSHVNEKDGKDDVHNCCKIKGSGREAEWPLCYNEDKSCFQAVFKHEYLEALGVALPQNSNGKVETKKVNWTKGVAICTENDCLRDADLNELCRWRPNSKCLPTSSRGP